MPKYSVFKESIKELPFKARMRHYFYQSIVNVKFWISNYHIKIVWCWIVGHDYQSAWGSVMCYRCGKFEERRKER